MCVVASCSSLRRDSVFCCASSSLATASFVLLTAVVTATLVSWTASRTGLSSSSENWGMKLWNMVATWSVSSGVRVDVLLLLLVVITQVWSVSGRGRLLIAMGGLGVTVESRVRAVGVV